ncbi:MAG: 2-hydroxychromene-2-carboxylate isomerase [Archangiaceae bacterium]|nr:2-hydroxychromene-2-carboxylate isomerase [Archangiaceae bacterium]
MSGAVEFFFDFMSPYSYLASTRVEAMVHPTPVVWRPCFLPGILRATENRGPAEIPAKLAHLMKDLNDWTEHLGLPPVRLPETVPFLATQANRCALVALDEGKGGPFITAMFRAIWRDGRSASDPQVLSEVLTSAGLDAAKVLDLAAGQPMKERLKAATDEAVSRGAFGVPAFFIGDEMFVGNDRLDFVVRRLARAR